jgi:hypothetical protein
VLAHTACSPAAVGHAPSSAPALGLAVTVGSGLAWLDAGLGWLVGALVGCGVAGLAAELGWLPLEPVGGGVAWLVGWGVA